MTLNVQQTKEMILEAAYKIIDSKDYLTKIDSEIGDGDHGIGMEIGCRKIIEVLNKNTYSDIAGLFHAAGKAMIFSMGGASGIIFGSLFQAGAPLAEKKDKLDGALFTTMMEQALVAIQRKGKAKIGDKTMVDALSSAVLAMKSVDNDLKSVLSKGVIGAEMGVQATKKMVAHFGRAAQLGERSLGHQDAGATSVWIILNAMKNYVENLELEDK